MCPPPNSPPPSEIDLQCNNEQIVLFLDKYSQKSNPPRNVLVGLNPYEYAPSNLPDGVWYLVELGEDKQWNHGIWKIKEALQEIYSNDVITGWKIVLEYFTGQVPNEEKTDWIMEEYGITQKGFCAENKRKDARMLCRVFHSPKIETHVQNSAAKDQLDELLASNILDFDPDSFNETMTNLEAELRGIVEADDNKTTLSPNSSELNCIEQNDYIELDDFEDRGCPGSVSSSSQNSSCTTVSDKYFDMADFVEEDEKKKLSNSKCAVVAPDKLHDAPPELEVTSDANATELLASPLTGTADVERPVPVPEPKTAKRGHSDSKSKDTATTSSDGETAAAAAAGPSRQKKAGSGLVKKLKPYFCFFF